MKVCTEIKGTQVRKTNQKQKNVSAYSKTCLKQPLKNIQNKDLNDKWKLNAGRKYCRMLPLKHSAIR